MVVAQQLIQEVNDTRIELISPTSITEVSELKDYMNDLDSDSGKGYCDINQPMLQESEILQKIVCITSVEGSVKYSNSRNLKRDDDINLKLNLKSSTIQFITSELLKKEVPKNVTLLNGHICCISLNQQRIPTLLKLQLVMDEESMKLLIWSFKKASIESTTTTDSNGFTIEDDLNILYKFKKFKFVLVVNQEGIILNAPNDLLKYIFGNNLFCNPRRIEELFISPEEIKYALKSECDQSDFYQKCSVSSLDLAVEESFSLKPIFSTTTRLKSQTDMLVSVNLFNSIDSRNNDAAFPVQVKYHNEHELETHKESESNGIFPQFPGFEVLRKLSESINSSIFEAIKLFQPGFRVIIKQIHTVTAQTNNNELKFYDFFCKEPSGCEFIEKPIKIELNPTPTVYMHSNQNQIDLFEYIYSNPYLSDIVVQRIFHQIAKAVEYLHNNQIIHRDIKDENVLIDTTNLSIKLIDFGSSAFLKDIETGLPEYVGTISYAPVEVLKGQAFNGPEQDVWCLGILLYVLCFKEPPFHSPKEILQGYLRLPIERPLHCIQLIRQMLDPKPKNRPNIQKILQNEFLKL